MWHLRFYISITAVNVMYGALELSSTFSYVVSLLSGLVSFFKSLFFLYFFLYIMAKRYTLSCVLLLYPESEIGIFRKILQGKLNFETNPWPSISEGAKDLIKKMLESNPKKRLTAHQVSCKLSCLLS